MYEDKLDGVIDAALFERKSAEAHAEQSKLAEQIERHRQANQSDIDAELANRAAELFEQQPAKEKRKLLRYVVHQCSWKNGRLSFSFKHPFDWIAETEQAQVPRAA